MKAVADTDRRRRDLARIHIVSKALGLSEDERRDVVFALTRRHSCADLDFTGLQAVRDHLERRAVSQGVKIPTKGRSSDAQIRMIRGLWIELGKRGKLEDKSPRALASFVRRQTGKDRLEWCSTTDKEKVIEGLKSWLKR